MRPTRYLLAGDARQLPLADASVHCVVTSPPYWGLRDYGLTPSVWGGDLDHAHEWALFVRPGMNGGTESDKVRTKGTENFQAFDGMTQATCACGAWRGVLGLEPTPELYVQHLVEIFREVRRVLRADGTCWLNLGDSFATTDGASRSGTKVQGLREAQFGHAYGNHVDAERLKAHIRPTYGGLKPKDLVGMPWRVAFALQADGWWLRSDIIWAKPNPMPESITDRPTKSHEYLFLLTKAARYYYDSEAIKEPNVETWSPNGKARTVRPGIDVNGGGQGSGCMTWHASGRNRRSVWTIATEPYPEAHFATFPEKLVEPCILAGTSERGACPACGAPWARVVEQEFVPQPDVSRARGIRRAADQKPMDASNTWEGVPRGSTVSRTRSWAPSCTCPPAAPVPCRVLDPFAGSGTTVAVAERLGRVGIGVELKAAYIRLAWARTRQAGLL